MQILLSPKGLLSNRIAEFPKAGEAQIQWPGASTQGRYGYVWSGADVLFVI